MNAVPDYRRNTASAATIAGHLWACDQHFVPPLSGRVAIDSYAQKLADRAERFEAWVTDGLIGLVAAYCNDPDRQTAFISSVSVEARWQGSGIASQLVGACVASVRTLGFTRLALEVDRRNTAAVALYGRLGFVAEGTDGPIITMAFHLG